MSRQRFEAAVRALDAGSVLGAFGIDEARPRCPRPGCGGGFEVYENDWAFGVSCRCTSPRCRLTEWAWPEHVLADLHGIDLAEAERRLLAGSRAHEERRRRETPRDRARRRLAERLT